jgi:hypothetical protein
MRFDWQTDEDEWENELETVAPNPAVSKKQKSLLWAALTLILILIGAAWYLSQLVKEQADGTTNDLSTEVLAAYALLNQSALENDFELFDSFLSPQNNYSRQLPLDLFRYHYFLNRPILHLYAHSPPPEQTPQVTFSPDLSRAQVVAHQAYTSTNETLPGSIWLERLTLFRKDDNDQWRLTRWPIDEEFWGETQEVNAGLLTAEFPTRDELYGHRLAQDIGTLLSDICANEAVNCPPNFRLKMLLVPYGQNLLDMNTNYRTLPLSSGYDAYRIFLPAPTLIGRPIDEAGYQALYQGYAAWIAAVLVQHYSHIRPVTHEVTAGFLNQWQLTPPPTPVLPGPVVEPVETLAEPVEAPTQDVLLICQGYNPPAWVTYSPDDDAWQTIPPPENSPALAHLLQQAGERSRFAPEGQGSLIRRPFTIAGAQAWHSYLWLGGLTNMLETSGSPQLFLAHPNHQQPDSNHLLFYPFNGQDNPYLAETAACLNNACELELLEGLPLWSPSGNRSLVVVQDENGTPQLFLGDERGRPLHQLTAGYSPQWLDESGFIFVGENGTTIYNGRLNAGGRIEEIERLADISSLFSPQILEELPQLLTITHLALHPSQLNWVGITVTNKNTNEDILLLLNRPTGALNFGFSRPNLRFSLPVQFSDDGRFLTITAFERGTLSGSWQILVFDLNSAAGNRQYNTGTAYYDWSADSQWLLIAEEDALRLIAPQHNYERQIPHTLGCHTVGWKDKSLGG